MTKTHIYPISGMHCRSCEILIARHVRQIPGVVDVRVDHRASTARVTTADGTHIDQGIVRDAVRAAGYDIGRPQKPPLISRSAFVWTDALVASCIVFIGWLIIKITGLDTIVSGGSSSVTATSAVIIGLTAGISTCMALVGGLVMAFAARHAEHHPEATALQKFHPHLWFNLGRLISFVLLGGAIGALGAIMKISVSTTGWLTIAAGLLMAMLGLSLVGIFPRMRTGISLPAGIARLVGLDRPTASYSHRGSLVSGALTFFLPCGFTQAMQVAAIGSGTFGGGALIMGAFAIGTTPGLLGIGGLASVLKGPGGRFTLKVIGVAVLLLGLWNTGNGWSLTGITLGQPASAAIGQAAQLPPVRNGVQVLQMKQWAGGYNPNKLTVRAGVPVRWEITADGAGCASAMVVPSLGIRKALLPGLNVLEFMPKQPGSIKFSCAMGMFRGTIAVVK